MNVSALGTWLLLASCHGGTAGSGAVGSSTASPASSASPIASAAPTSTATEKILDASVTTTDGGGDDASNAPPDMARVPGGTFTMGADRGGEEDEHPAHSVTIPGFWLDRTEVTNAAYASCVSAKKCRPSDRNVAAVMHAGPDEGFHRPLQPVVGVGWNDAH
ncbi:MAG: SUMF1/EgtB/PvdO family nonheme iron enzyme, partial [Polyangiaceae bacterium]